MRSALANDQRGADQTVRAASHLMIDTILKKSTVLVVDNEAGIRRLLRVCLERNGYGVVEASTGDEGIGETIRCHPDAVFLDMGLPDMHGMTVLKRLREWTQVPVLIVSECAREIEKVKALDGGANDYITKPFNTDELMARLRVTQRPHVQPSANTEVFQHGHLSVDLTSRTVKLKGNRVKLTPTEYALLRLFVQNAGKVLTHSQILREISGPDGHRNLTLLRVYLSYLREKLEINPAKPELFITEPGVGYRFTLQE
jgi:two-component system KDP operon response regulator KdpE